MQGRNGARADWSYWGHMRKLIRARFVEPYVKSNKKVVTNAPVVALAATRPNKRFVETRTPEQVDLQALRRVRDRMIAHRKHLVSQMRAFSLYYIGLPFIGGLAKSSWCCM